MSGQHIIGGEPVAGDGKVFQAVNPASGEALPIAFCEGGAAEVAQAADLAERDFPALQQLDHRPRAALLDTIAAELTQSKLQLVARAMLETGLPQGRLEGELLRTTDQLKQFARSIESGAHLQRSFDPALPERQPQPRPELRMTQVPLGPVAVFGASNFPFAFSVAGGDTAAALAAGCPVIHKGHPAHPGTCELAARAIASAVEQCRLPRGVFSLLQGSGHALGAELVQHPLIRAVAFTGSQAAGRALFDLASSRPEPIPVFAEMGSVNPVFILPKILHTSAEQLATQFSESVCLGGGQFCTKPGILVIHKGSGLDRFLLRAQYAFALQPAATMLHAGIKRNYLAGLQNLAGFPGVRPVGSLPASPPGGCAVRPALLQMPVADFLATPQAAEEVFGPVSLLVVCDSLAQMQQVARSFPGQLTASVHAASSEESDCRALFAILQRKAGRLILNGFPTGVEVCRSMVHGGPYPATTDSRTSSVGTTAIQRFLRPICLQGVPEHLWSATPR